MPDEEKIQFAARLKAARKTAGFKSARQFFQKHQFMRTTYMQHEGAQRMPNDEIITQYCQFLNVNFEWLKYGRGDPLHFKQDDRCHLLENELHAVLFQNTKKNNTTTFNEELLAFIFEELINLHQKHQKNLDGQAISTLARKFYSDVLNNAADSSQYLAMAKVALTTYAFLTFQNR
jgi:hypothetical protein